jgi:Tol biopolymer transport system component
LQGLIAFANLGTECITGEGFASVNPALTGIWVLDPVTDAKRRITDRGHSPTWSPDGKRIAFAVPFSIFVVDVDSGVITPVTQEGLCHFPAWSPDGAWIAYDRTDLSVGELWMITPDGKKNHRVNVDSLPSMARRSPAWHPDMSALLYAGGLNLVRLDLDEHHEDLIVTRPGNAFHRKPAYSFDALRIVFESRNQGAAGLSNMTQVWMSAEDGSQQSQLTLCGGEHPSWSPDGSQVVYTKRNNVRTPEDGVLWLLDVAQGKERQLTFQPPCDE